MDIIPLSETKPATEIRSNILAFEEMLLAQEGSFTGDTVNCPVKHHFTDGIYTREIFIPAGKVLTGKIHKHRHPNFLMSGKVRVVTEFDGDQILEGPLFMISEPGTKRVVHSLTDCVWFTIHKNETNTQDLTELEDEIIAPSYEKYFKFVETKEKLI